MIRLMNIDKSRSVLLFVARSATVNDNNVNMRDVATVDVLLLKEGPEV